MPRARRRRRATAPGVVTALRAVVGLLALALIVQLLSWWGPQEWRIPGLADIVDGAGRIVFTPQFLPAILSTLLAIVASTGIGFVGALVFGTAFGLSPFAFRAFGLPFEILRSLPSVAFIPLAILALGQGVPMVIAVGAGCWWPMLYNTIYGVRQVDPVAIDAARIMGTSRFGIIRRVVIPSMFPFVLAGLRTSAPVALIIVITAEYLVSAGAGLGGLLIAATSTGDIGVLWAVAIIAGLFGIAIGGVVELIYRLACPWSWQKERS